MKKKLLGKNMNLISLDEPYEVMRQLLKEHEVTGIIDGGASDGRISKRLLRKFPAAHAYAFEPNPLYFDPLQQYAKEGNADLYITESPGCTSLLSPGKRLEEISPHGASVKSVEKIRIVTIDEWARRSANPAIQVMKFDIQGEELRALRGAVRVLHSSTLLVYTEIWFNCPYEGGAIYSEIDLFLREHGFILYDIYKPKYNTNQLIIWGNAIFLNIRLLDM
jgi:FkbM family methyltransferase